MKKNELEDVKKNPFFCAYPFVQLSTVPAGFVRPCCFFSDTLKINNLTKANVNRDSFQEIWNCGDIKSIRQKLIRGEKVSGCKQCYQEESFAGDSMRKRSLREWEKREEFVKTVEYAAANNGEINSAIRFLELKPGNLCNLKCRMCNQFDSSKYAAELKEISKDLKSSNVVSGARLFDKYNFELDFDLSKMANWHNNKKIWDSFEKLAGDLEILSFAGGEPSIIEEVYKVLEFCVEQNFSKNLTVYLASNFTQNLDRMIVLAKNFKRFDFIASIDGCAEVQEYIRFPSVWKDIESNFHKVCNAAKTSSNINVLVNITVDIYNIMQLTDLLNWIESEKFIEGLKEDPFNLNILMFPEYLSFKLLPKKLRAQTIQNLHSFSKKSWICNKKPHIKQRVNQLSEMLKSDFFNPKDEYKLLSEFWIYTKILDKYRKQDFEKLMPALAYEITNELNQYGFDFDQASDKFSLN